jgi:hypothetical protein
VLALSAALGLPPTASARSGIDHRTSGAVHDGCRGRRSYQGSTNNLAVRLRLEFGDEQVFRGVWVETRIYSRAGIGARHPPMARIGSGQRIRATSTTAR